MADGALRSAVWQVDREQPLYRMESVEATLENRNSGGPIGRFGWKAQHHSLLLFTAEAYNVEQGVSNEGRDHNVRTDSLNQLTTVIRTNTLTVAGTTHTLSITGDNLATPQVAALPTTAWLATTITSGGSQCKTTRSRNTA